MDKGDMQADAVVVGAGPAGSSTAHYLAMAGLRVLLLEKSTFPRDKVCGDGLTPRAVAELVRMGVDTSGWARNTGLRAVGGGHTIELPWPETASLPNFGLACPRTELDAALAATEVSHLSDRDIMTLSGGERARVALSRVLAQQTPVVLLDEPTAALDIGHQEQALGLVRALAKNGAAVIVVLHDLNAAAAYCDRIVCLADGTVAAQGTVAEVYTEETLTAVYGWDIQVVSSPAGDVQVFPKRGREAGVDNDLQETLSELFNLTFN